VNQISKTRAATTAAGLSLLIPASLGLLVSNVPTILCPFPALTVLPAFLLSEIHLWKAAVVVPTVFFFAWHPKLFQGSATIPKRTYFLLIVAALLSVVDFVTSWNWGLQFQGARHTHVVCAINAVWIASLIIAFARGRNVEPSFGLSLFLHWMLFVWLAWYAFPYLGELP
jgi:hypothetical protein